MGLERSLDDKRLLIVVEDADYREALADLFMPDRLVAELSGRVSPVDVHILTAAYQWSTQAQSVAIVSCQSAEEYSEESYLNIRLMGSGLSGERASQDMSRLVADYCPTHIVMCTPSLSVLRWAVRNRISTIVLLSEWQEPLGWRQRWQHNQLISLLNHSSVEWVGSHGVHACRILKTSGVDARKLIPWEWPQPQLMEQYPPKRIQGDQSAIHLAYAGPLEVSAGIDDLLRAMGELQRRGHQVSLQLMSESPAVPFIAAQNIARLRAQTNQLGLENAVTFWQDLSLEQMLEKVHRADLTVIPRIAQSLSVIPFGLSLSMAARTPVVACDYPYFVEHLFHGINAMIFPAGNFHSMAHRIERVMGQPALYAQLSEASEIDFERLKVPARWAELIDRWLQGSAYDRQRLRDFALSSGRYQALTVLRSSASTAIAV
ncbi:MAG: glycosyltransferase [Cyanobacteria bacterium J06614_10]